MKKGISLIVLVITIIVMIILAAAIIISISNSNIINKANKAVSDTNIATIKEAAALKYADVTLAIKEAGDDSILGGKTVGEYIEQQLINDGTMKESDAVIFTPKGGVYGPGEYNSIPDKTEASDWRYIDNKLYYVGTDVDKRLALKNNSDVSVEYILIDSTYDTVNPENFGGFYTIGSVGLSTKITSYHDFLGNNYLENDGKSISNVVLATGTRLYKDEIEVGQVVIFGDTDCWGDNFINSSYSGDSVSVVSIAAGSETYQAYFDDMLLYGDISQEDYDKFNSSLIFELAADVNIDGVVNLADGYVMWFLLYSSGADSYIGKKTIAGICPTNPEVASNVDTVKQYFKMDKVITKLPMDLRK